MSSAPKRPLVKGPLQPPQSQSKSTSYAQRPTSKNEVFITSGKEQPTPVIEFNSQATPQPFLDLTIIPKRIQAEKQHRAEQDKKTQASASSQSRH
ncbi:uncharacterized protein LY89DRAFT_23953 [Mollisia scopiformis]|uniref:Uncharacterized protein n=1 Tax=Mollisia scopiformis TaxID=149040 RepID=A0A194XXH4_MOLSC|nr:uncharacterized protein LY89DRAFT_23953 [Mollisia scopiformis]KUJ24507.1 hypothetical protein LY89DRAFT_23953 [Mollisia scopiformis]